MVLGLLLGASRLHQRSMFSVQSGPRSRALAAFVVSWRLLGCCFRRNLLVPLATQKVCVGIWEICWEIWDMLWPWSRAAPLVILCSELWSTATCTCGALLCFFGGDGRHSSDPSAACSLRWGVVVIILWAHDWFGPEQKGDLSVAHCFTSTWNLIKGKTCFWPSMTKWKKPCVLGLHQVILI